MILAKAPKATLSAVYTFSSEFAPQWNLYRYNATIKYIH